MRKLKILLIIVICIIILVLLAFATILIINSINNYKPLKEEVLIKSSNSLSIDCDTCTFSFLTWNIGYCGLGKEMDFFYEGGKKVRPSKQLYQKYYDSISKYLVKNIGIDFILLQETDLNSKRSYRNNQYQHFCSILNSHTGFYAVNYDVKFVFLPLNNPMGKVQSGLACFSKYEPYTAIRYSLPGSYKWPKNLFFFDRCIIVSKYLLKNNRELVIINVHNSAFDDAIDIREKEMNFIKGLMQAEYKKGNYVVAGGDWNINPYGFKVDKVKSSYKVKTIKPSIESSFFDEGWQWVFDNYIPTNRDVKMEYKQSETNTTILDFFIVSPNVKILYIKTEELHFNFSDHNPVKMKIQIQLNNNKSKS